MKITIKINPYQKSKVTYYVCNIQIVHVLLFLFCNLVDEVDLNNHGIHTLQISPPIPNVPSRQCENFSPDFRNTYEHVTLTISLTISQQTTCESGG